MNVKNKNERIQLYRKYQGYFNSRLVIHPKIKKRKFDIATQYINTDQTLQEVGRKFGISKDRVRQITFEFLFVVVRIYNRNKVEIRDLHRIKTPARINLDQAMKNLHQAIDEYVTDELRRQTSEELASPSIGIPLMRDEDVEGYYLDDIKDFLEKDQFKKFLKFNEGKDGGVVNGKYYVFKQNFNDFLSK